MRKEYTIKEFVGLVWKIPDIIKTIKKLADVVDMMLDEQRDSINKQEELEKRLEKLERYVKFEQEGC